MTLTLAIILLSLLSTITNSQPQNCQIFQQSTCKISPVDLISNGGHALVQTISPTMCMPAVIDSFYLDSFRVEFNIGTNATTGPQTMDLQLTIFIPQSSGMQSALQNYDTTYVEGNYIIYSQEFTGINVNSGAFSYQFTGITYSEPPCPGDIAIVIEVTQWGSGVNSIQMTECQRDPIKVSEFSTLTYYDVSMRTEDSLRGIVSSAGNSAGTYNLKLDPLQATPAMGVCDGSSGGGGGNGMCGDGTMNGLCVDVCSAAVDPSPFISQIGEKWIQFIDKPTDCTGDGMYIYGIGVYLTNPQAINVGFMIGFKMRLMSINDADGIDELSNGKPAQSPYYTQTQTVTDGSFQNSNGYYEMYFGFPATQPIQGQDCSNPELGCKYYWELTLESNDGLANGYGVNILGCANQGATDAKTVQYYMNQYLDKDTYTDGVNNYNEFDISYNTNGKCDDTGSGDGCSVCIGGFDVCYATEYDYITVIVEPSSTQMSIQTWLNQQQNIEAQCGNAFFEMISDPTSNYCYDYWCPACNCGCLNLEYLNIHSDQSDQYVSQFEMRFSVNAIFRPGEPGTEHDVEQAKTDFGNNLKMLLNQNYGENGYDTNNRWFQQFNHITFNVIQLSMDEESGCSADITHFVTIIIEHDDDDISEDDWNDYKQAAEMQFALSFYDSITMSSSFNANGCPDFDLMNGEDNCGCIDIDGFDFDFEDGTQITITFELNDDIYKLVPEDVSTVTETFEEKLSENFDQYQSWFSSTEPFEIVSFEFEETHMTTTESSDDSICSDDSEKQITMEFEILTEILFDIWYSNINTVKETCKSTFISLMTELLGEIMDSRCFTMQVNIEDLAPSSAKRRLLANDPEVGVKIAIEISVKKDVYDETFNNPSSDFDENTFGSDFMETFAQNLKTKNENDEIDWYTDDAVEYKFNEMELDDEINGNAPANVAFINFKEDPMQIGISTVLLIAVTIGVFGYLNSMCRGADNFRYSAVFFFGLYTWDFFSDVFFSALLYTSKLQDGSGDLVYWGIFGLSVLFIVLPVLLNFHSLLKFQSKWQGDNLHADRYRAWLSQYANILFFMSFLSGSTFGAIALVNSNFLGWRLFAMGLSEKDMREFNQKRLANVVLGENLPQLLVQIVYTGVSAQFELVAFLAICSSSISIAAAVYSFLSNKGFLADSSVQHSLFSIKVTCNQTEFLKHPGHYKNKTYVLATEIARIFPLDRSCVEILPTEKFSDKNHEGLMIYFFINTSKKQPGEIYQDLKESMDIEDNQIVSHLGKQIAKAWGLRYGEQCGAEEQVKTYDLNWVNKDFMDEENNTGGGTTNGKNVEMATVNSKTNLTNTNENIVSGETEGVKNDNIPIAAVHQSQNSSHPAEFETIDVDKMKEENDEQGDVL